MRKNILHDEDVLLSALDYFSELRERQLISILYMAKRSGSVDISIDFFIDIFGLNSKKTKELMKYLQTDGLVKVKNSMEYDPELLVPKYRIYSPNGLKPSDEAVKKSKKIFDSIKDLNEEEIRNLGLMIYLKDTTNDLKKAIDSGLKIGISPERVEQGIKLLQRFSSEKFDLP